MKIEVKHYQKLKTEVGSARKRLEKCNLKDSSIVNKVNHLVMLQDDTDRLCDVVEEFLNKCEVDLNANNT